VPSAPASGQDDAYFWPHYYNGFAWGATLNITPGYGERDLRYVRCFFWLCGNWDDQLSFVRTYDSAAILFSDPDYRGWCYFVGPYQWHPIAPWFNDLASSAYVYA
jgi:hypothetical protein